ncbi:endonuclease III domain-containing protein [Brachybacterium saurashtrense]|uniref:Endonuclease III n=1 Tax=Brachybacterium saurashtrense TaxID=556288 RepID=A0A345YTJ8_9MICO|nr:endonuclease III [Brachybacterium saurashtrense]AXK47250.1 endonuclease III [Brachybacterium saurashtrense]RRR24372.1 endonuclease III [Brachybacterium saurashtrense]
MSERSSRAGAGIVPEGPAPAGEVAARLAEHYADARTELDHRDAFELLVATVLSAQTTDVRVNLITPELFSRWPYPAALAAAEEAAVAEVVRPLGMGPTRARRLRALAQGLLAQHGGVVPDDQDALEALPGVGRKTAHVVRGAWFGRSLLAVDTHVGRLARRLGWSAATAPRAVEEDVVARVEADCTGAAAEDLTVLGLRLILHGRRVCTARAPRCEGCVLADLCPREGVDAR